jgi:aerobic-type carbon monoxide dehydrogenase small subunit (CoxS/CutS family)
MTPSKHRNARIEHRGSTPAQIPRYRMQMSRHSKEPEIAAYSSSQWARPWARSRSTHDFARCTARRARFDRHEEGVQSRPMRCLHCAYRRRSWLSCLTLAVSAQGHAVTTIEGLAAEGQPLHPMQEAFADHDALQCGYCTPGQIMSAIACVNAGMANSPDSIREYMSGNLCRCGAYPNIVSAILEAKELMPSKPASESQHASV